MKKLLSLLLACACLGLMITLGVSQEVPVGSISGSIEMKENGRPLPGALVVLTPAVHRNERMDDDPALNDDYEFDLRNWHARAGKDGHFQFSHIPSGNYRIEVDARQHSLKSRIIQIQEGAQAPLEIKLAPNSPSLELSASQKVIAPETTAAIEVNGFTPADRLQLSVRKLKVDQVLEKGGIRSALEPVTRQKNGLDQSHVGEISEKTYQEEVKIEKKDAEGAFVQPVKIPPLSEGLYFITVAGNGLTASVFLNVSKIALVTKTANRTSLCYVTDIETGKPLGGVPLSVSSKNSIRQVATTDETGIATITLADPKESSQILARVGNSVAFSEGPMSTSEAGDGGEDEDQTTNPNIRIFTYTDRPVYRPGDLVRFKSVIRRLKGEELELPETAEAKIKILDDQDNLLETQELRLTSHGTLHGQFSTSSEAKPGTYTISVTTAGATDKYSLNLAAYRKPDYSVKVTPKENRYRIGDQAEAEIECQYFFGGPVVGAKVKATINRSPAWESMSDDNDDTGADESEGFSGGQFVENVEAVTDGTGKAIVRFATTNDQNSDEAYTDYRYSIEASVSASSGREIEGSNSVLVTRGGFQLKVDTDPTFLTVQEKGDILVDTESFDPTPRPVAGKPVAIVIERQTYTGHTIVFEPIQKFTVVTDGFGKASVPVTPSEEGDIRIRATASDGPDHPIQTQAFLWVSGSASKDPNSNANVKVKLDKKNYSVGQTAKILVSTNRPGGVALLTIESDTVKSHRLVDLSHGSAIVKILVDKSLTPNAFASVSYVFDRTYSESSNSINAHRKEKQLLVSVTPDAKKSLPGVEVGFSVKTSDTEGKPVPANLSFGLVDESIYAIKKDQTNIAAQLYPRKSDLVQTNYSFPEIYLDGGDKGGGSIPVRRKFLDTAAWIPDVQTDAQGKAHVKVKIPDNLTSWRATVVAASDATAVGMATTNLIASKPLMVRITAPQFLVATDSQTLGADITNDSGSSLLVNLSVRADGLRLGETKILSMSVEQGETKTIPLPVSAPASGMGVVTATVSSDKGFSDAVESKFSILPHARLVENDLRGLVSKRREFKVEVSPSHDPHAGSLDISVTPSIASGLIQSLDQLVQFPYGCVEQTMSRFLPAVRVVKAVKGTSLERRDLDLRSGKIAVDGFARLRKMQHDDGGWGWWTYDDSDPFMTAWVLDGFKTLEACGQTIPEGIDTEKALQWAAKRLRHPEHSDTLDGRLYLLLATAQYGQTPDGKSLLESMDLRSASLGELALTALAANEVGADEISERAIQNVEEEVQDETTHVRRAHLWWSEDEELALALRALVQLRPDDPVVTTAVLRLQGLKRWDGWVSTRATTIATLALCDYLAKYPQSVSASKLRLSLNGTFLREVEIDPTKQDLPNLRLSIPIAKLRTGENTVELEDKGGEPFVATTLREYDQAPVLNQVIDDSSLSVQRSYYRLEPTRTDDGSMSLLPSKTPRGEFQSGDVIRCEITVHCKHPVDFIFVEDPLPSNCKVTDREDPMDGENWDYWWSNLTIMDDRVAMFAREMPAGTHVLTYTMRAEGTGTSSALPTHVENMYVPEISASGAENRVEVR